MADRFSETLLRASQPVWDEAVRHPFVQELVAVRSRTR